MTQINKISTKLLDWLYKNKDNNFIQLFAKTTLYVLTLYEEVTSYFERKVEVHIKYIHTDDGKKPDTVNGWVIRKGCAHYFSGIPWEDMDDIIKILLEENKPINFEIEHGWYFQEIYLPKWARKKLAIELTELKK